MSPLVVQPRTSSEEHENEVFARQEKAPSNLVRQPLRSNMQILNLFEKVAEESEIQRDNVENKSKKRDASSPVREKKTSVVDSPQTAAKM